MCKVNKVLLSAYIDNELSLVQTNEIQKHLSGCALCQQEFESLRRIQSLCRQIQPKKPSREDWGRFQERLTESLPKVETKRKTLYTILRYAAVVLIAIAVYLYNPYGEETNSKQYSISQTILGVKEARARKNLASEEVMHKEIQINPSWKQLPETPNAPIKGLAQAHLSPKELDFLNKHGFVVTTKQYSSFRDLYVDNQQNAIPSFVTMDTAISGLSHILSRLRVDLEEEIFLQKLTIFTRILREQLLALESEVPPSCKKASTMALSFVKIASILLDCDGKWPQEVENELAQTVQQEMELIHNPNSNRLIGIQKSPIFDYDLDYNRFQSRWNETQNPKLRNYYLAMEWYSRCVFRTSSIPETQAALLLLMASMGKSPEGDAIMIWDEMNQLLSALYGRADDPHLLDYLENAREVFGDTLSPELLTDTGKLHRFCRDINRTKLPRIRSETGLKGGLRIFGGRYYDRDMILQQFCNPSVGDKNDPRVIPSILDIAVIMNHPKAMEIAKEKDFFHLPNYEAKISSYRTMIEAGLAKTQKPWEVGGMIGDAWIYKTLIDPEGRGYPTFCRNDAWEFRKLTTILLGVVSFPSSKPIFTGVHEENFSAIVDPYPELFNRILTSIRNLEKLLYQVGYPSQRPPAQEIIAYKKSLEEVVNVAEKMLSAQKLTQEDQNQLGKFVLGWEGNYEEANVNELSTLFHRNETQCDFYFLAAVEPIREMWVVCPGQYMSFLARGGVYILYEFPTEKKVVPEKWREEKLWEPIKKRGMGNVAPWSAPYAE